MRANSGKLATLFLLLLALVSANSVFAAGSVSSVSLFAPAVYETTACTVVVNPGQSLQTAVSNARSGQTVCVRGGTYVGQVQLKPAQSGVTLIAYPGERPIIDGQNRYPVTTARNRFPGLLHVTGSNIVVDGFDIRNSNARGVVVAQPPKASPLQNIVIRNNIVQNSREVGMVVTGASSTLRVRNVLVENNVIYNNVLKNAGGAAGGSALTFVEAENSTARGNRIHHNYGEGLVADRFSSNIVLEYNVTYDNRGANLYLINTQNPIVRGNYVFCTDDPIGWRGKGSSYRAGPGLQVRDEDFRGGDSAPPPSSGQVIINNIVVGCGSNFGVATQIAGGGLNNALVANNSFINARGATATAVNNIEFEGRASYRNSRFVNNIILQSVPGMGVRVQTSQGTPSFATFTISNNLYSQAPANGWPASEPGRIVGYPLLVNAVTPLRNAIPAPGSYALAAGSPAIDRGTAVAQVTHDFFGAARVGAHDIGADESGGANNRGNAAADGLWAAEGVAGLPQDAVAAESRIVVRVDTTPAGDPQMFDFVTSFGEPFQLAGGGEQTFSVAPGRHSLMAGAPPGWTQTDATCDDGSASFDIALEAAETVTCLFSYERTE